MTKTATPDNVVHVIGGGLAGSEAAFQIAQRGVPVILHEMRPVRMTDAHQTEGLAELVCSNSFRSDDAESNAVGVLHEEMRMMGSVIMTAADQHKVPAGVALAVDRDGFSQRVQQILSDHPMVTLEREEVTDIPEDWSNVIVATGPLTSPALAQMVRDVGGEDDLAFSTPLRRLSISTASTWIGPGSSHATTNPRMAATARTISTARWTRRSMTVLSRRFWKARR